MLSTALALQETTKQVVHDEEIMAMAAHIFHSRNEADEHEFAQMLYMYSAHIAALTTTLATHVLLTEQEINSMLDTIKEFDSLGKDIENGNNN
jgi:methionine synthase II (cobalamin-independent)